jgi:hypothetical protein
VIDGEAQPLLGSGLNTDSDKYKASGCLNGTVQNLGNGAASLEASITRDYEKIVETEGYKVGGNIKVAWFKFSAEHSASHTITQEAFAQTFLLDYKVKMGNQSFVINKTTPFNGFGQAVLNNATSFKNQCGNCFVYQNERGARLQVAMSFAFTSANYHDEFKTSAGAGIEGLKIGSFSLGAGLQGEINKLTDITRQHGTLTLYAKQVGGSVAYLGQVFGSSSNGVYATQCALTDLTACTNALNSVIAYISSAEFINGLATSSAPLKYYYSSYGDAVPNVPFLPEELTNDILQAREQLKTELVKRETALAQVNRQLLLPYLSAASNDRLTALKNKLVIEITNLQTQGQRCFDVLSSCVAEKNALLAGLTLLNEQTLGLSLADGMVAYYPFNNNFQDATQNYNHGMMRGAVTFTKNRFNQTNSAVYLSPGNYVEVPHSSSLNLTTAFTFSAWVNVAVANGYSTILGKPHGWNGYNFSLKSGITPSVAAWNRWADSYVTIPLFQWSLVTATYDGSYLRFYTNGKLGTQMEITGNVGITGDRVCIGVLCNGDGQSWFTGGLDDLRIYNRALTATEVSSLFYDKSAKTALNGTTNWAKPPYSVTCQNISTNKQVSIAANKTADYDCGKAGLAVTTGQKVKVIVEGNKY